MLRHESADLAPHPAPSPGAGEAVTLATVGIPLRLVAGALESLGHDIGVALGCAAIPSVVNQLNVRFDFSGAMRGGALPK